MKTERTSEYKIGPFTWDESLECIQKFARALTNLKLDRRFSINGTPQKLGHGFYQVILIDKKPGEPKPEGLTTLHIHAAEKAGYAKPKVTYYNAFGQRMTLGKWAEVAGVTRPTLKARLDAGMTVEEAITDVALKRGPVRKAA